jgi:hypothetical protein
MNNDETEQKVWDFLKDKGISRQVLLDAADFFYPLKEKNENKDNEERKKSRGRPIKYGIKSVAFYLCANYYKSNGTLPTEKKLTTELDEIRKIVLTKYNSDEKSAIPNEFRSPVKNTTIRVWIREFKETQKENSEYWEYIYSFIDMKYKNINSNKDKK